MKILTLTIFLFLSFVLHAQKNVIGRYRDYFGSRIELNADGSFKYSWHFDLAGSWTKGSWFIRTDTVYFQMIPTHDTISYKTNHGINADKLILSVDESAERLTPEQLASRGLSSGGQNVQSHPERLLFRKGRLYKLHNGQLIVKRQKRFLGGNKKWPPWYFKSDD